MFWNRLNYKYYLSIIMGYALLLTISIGCIFMQADRVYTQIIFFNKGEYQYTYQTTKSTQKNDYLNCTSVYFYTDNGLTNSLLCDCFMMLEDSIYDYETPINQNKSLGNREIILTYNLAKQHKLEIGSKIYSKHNIKNTIEEYTVVEILPVSYGILNVDYNINYGLMIIGYDELYISNTDYSYVGFSKDDPSELIQTKGAGLISLDIKELYQEKLIEKVFLWQGIIALIVAFITFVFIVFHWKNQRNYYERLVIYGCPIRKIKKQILFDIFVPGILGLLLSLLFSICILSLYNMYISYFAALISVVSGLLSLMISTLIILYKEKNF